MTVWGSLPTDARDQPAGWLFRRYAPSVRRYSRSIVLDEHEAEDVTQQVFLKLMGSLESYRAASGPLEPRILRITRQTALDHLRRRRLLQMTDVDPFHAAAGERSTPGLRKAMSDLTDAQREVVVLMHLGLSAAEVAEVTDRSPASVHALHNRALQRLRRSLEPSSPAPSTRRANPFRAAE
jgi:RNA polymerase sigma-70 factor (ECF subfamily)